MSDMDFFTGQRGIGIRLKLKHKPDVRLDLATSLSLTVVRPSNKRDSWNANIVSTSDTATVVESTADIFDEAGEWRVQVRADFSSPPTPYYSDIFRFTIHKAL